MAQQDAKWSKTEKIGKIESDDEDNDEVETEKNQETENENFGETETSKYQPERRTTRSMTRTSIGENTRVTRSMSRENEALAPNINDIVEFAMVGGTNESYVNPRNF